MNGFQKTLSALGVAFMVNAMAMNAYGITQSDYDSFENVDRTEWSHVDGFTARANLQNPTSCGLAAFFVPHATLRGDDDLSQAEKRGERNREFLCRNLVTGEEFERAFVIDM